jgi:hypothetical protein
MVSAPLSVMRLLCLWPEWRSDCKWHSHLSECHASLSTRWCCSKAGCHLQAGPMVQVQSHSLCVCCTQFPTAAPLVATSLRIVHWHLLHLVQHGRVTASTTSTTRGGCWRSQDTVHDAAVYCTVYRLRLLQAPIRHVLVAWRECSVGLL